MLLTILLFVGFLLLFIELIYLRFDDKKYFISIGSKYGKELEDLILKEYDIKKSGFGPWWLFTRESDMHLQIRALKKHLLSKPDKGLPSWFGR